MIKSILVAMALLFAVGAQADTTAKIDKILMYEGRNLVYIYPVGSVQNKPACHGANGYYLSFRRK
ncbi:hypothetical protein [Arsukibacterium sp. MJ3]|uniref:hypothetical protein n=1 Tax=Arsukibacterium sp. MJ3 TaxID=1632859 RepID=UPI001F40F30A|nr:hypothetical protein [Arsukibacterium sp. MJ3]